MPTRLKLELPLVPAWRDLLIAVSLVAAIVMLNLFADAVQRSVERGMALRQAQSSAIGAASSVRLAEARADQAAGSLR